MKYRGKMALAHDFQRRALKEKDHYRYDPMHRRKPGVGWTPTEAGWTKPRPGSQPAMLPVAKELTRIARLLMQ